MTRRTRLGLSASESHTSGDDCKERSVGSTRVSIAAAILFLLPWPILWIARSGPPPRKNKVRHRWSRSHCLVIGLFVVPLLCYLSLYLPITRAQTMQRNGNLVELTEVDLFSLPDWQDRSVAIEGFVLGMARSEATKHAQDRGLKLRSKMPPKTAGEMHGPCLRASCSVAQIQGDFVGIVLYFDAADRVTKMSVEVSVDMFPEVKKVNVSRRFKGL